MYLLLVSMYNINMHNKYWQPKIIDNEGVFFIATYHNGPWSGHYINKSISFKCMKDAVDFVNNFMYGRLVLDYEGNKIK